MTNIYLSRNDEYKSRINRVLDYIQHNLDKDMTLEQLASVANFSPYHFHRLFRTLVGEPLYQFILRLRIERAAVQLCEAPNKPITDIAYDCGFSSPAVFARAFKDFFGMTASDLRSGGSGEISKIRKTMSKDGERVTKSSVYFSNEFNIDYQQFIWRITMKEGDLKTTIEVKDFPEMHVAYLRHIGPYAGNEQLFASLFGKLFAWAGARGLIRFPETKVISIYHDNPEITEEDKLRTSVCISVPQDTPVEGEIGKMTVPGGKYAVAHFEILPTEYGKAWDMVYGAWLPESGYQPDDRPCFEMYMNDPKQHPQGIHIVDIYAPVKPL